MNRTTCTRPMTDDALLTHVVVLRDGLSWSQIKIAQELDVPRGKVCQILRLADSLGLFGGRRVLNDEQRMRVARLRPMFAEVFAEYERKP